MLTQLAIKEKTPLLYKSVFSDARKGFMYEAFLRFKFVGEKNNLFL